MPVDSKISPLRILLINAINPAIEVEERYPNLGLYYLISALEQINAGLNMEIKVCGSNAQKTIADFRPHLAGISSVTQNFPFAGIYATAAKDAGATVIAGGVHITAVPDSLHRDMDFGVRGEGEEVFSRLVRLFSEHGSIPDDMALKLPGVFCRRNGELAYSESRFATIADLNGLPMLARNYIPSRLNNSIMTSRGCPHECSFCFSQAVWSKSRKVRYFFPQRIVDELVYIKEHTSTRFIDILDDLFCGNRKRISELIDLLRVRGLLGTFTFHCNCRANYVTPELASLLRTLGVKSVGIGFESHNPRILRYLKGEGITPAHNVAAVKILRDNGISIRGTFVIGSPGEGREEIMDTYNFIKSSSLELFDVFLLTPYPGTRVWNDAVAQGRLDPGIDPSRLNLVFGNNPDDNIIVSEVLTRQELLGYYRKFKRLRVRKILFNIWRTPWLGVAWRGAVQSILLKRKRVKRN
jgi:anaerobic magnesium-protoporphyrin IX monomethyl ester cyclase